MLVCCSCYCDDHHGSSIPHYGSVYRPACSPSQSSGLYLLRMSSSFPYSSISSRAPFFTQVNHCLSLCARRVTSLCIWLFENNMCSLMDSFVFTLLPWIGKLLTFFISLEVSSKNFVFLSALLIINRYTLQFSLHQSILCYISLPLSLLWKEFTEKR